MKVFIKSLLLFAILLIPIFALGDTVAPPRSYAIFSSDNKFVFVMIASIPIERDGISYGEKGLQEAKRIRAKYQKSGLYRNDDSTKPLWTVDWYSYSVQVASDGIHLIRRGPWASKSSDEAFTFFGNGKEIRSYKISDLVSSIEDLPHSVSHFQWEDNMVLNDEKFTLSVTTLNCESYVFDYRTGKRLSKVVTKCVPKTGFGTDSAYNKSMDVRAKQRLCYQTGLVVLKLCGGGFAPRHLNRSAASRCATRKNYASEFAGRY